MDHCVEPERVQVVERHRVRRDPALRLTRGEAELDRAVTCAQDDDTECGEVCGDCGVRHRASFSVRSRAADILAQAGPDVSEGNAAPDVAVRFPGVKSPENLCRPAVYSVAGTPRR